MYTTRDWVCENANLSLIVIYNFQDAHEADDDSDTRN